MQSFIVGAFSVVITLVTLGVGVCFLVTVRKLPTLRISNHHSDTPELTVVVPARNEEQDLKAAVESILAQQDILLHVVIVKITRSIIRVRSPTNWHTKTREYR